ncbi:MAG: T9SS type A sorting domain-containing protein [Elusimicrobiaceae bacterium]|jgi:hypothetical protein
MPICFKNLVTTIVAPALFACVCAGPSFAMAGTKYSVRMLTQSSGGSATSLTGRTYSVLGSLGQMGAQNSSGAKYSLNSGIINSLQPAMATLDYAYAFPNPFKKKLGHTTITFTKLTYEVSIKIFTVSGELIKTLGKSNSIDSIIWDARTESGQYAASGLYIYLIESGGMRKTGKLIIIR